MIRVLIAEDSAVAREYLVHLVQEDPELEMVAAARNGIEAIELAERLRPDVILMDVHMPEMNGYDATREIMTRVPTPIVMVSASINGDEVAMSFEALQAGALTLLEKPGGPGHPDEMATTERLRETVKLMAGVKVIRRFPHRQRPVPRPPDIHTPDRQIRVVAIGASTGGPPVVADILRDLAPDLRVPILVVQHITRGFSEGLAQWLGQTTGLTVKLAEPGEATRAGAVYLAPDGLQMGITKNGRIEMTKKLVDDTFCPSVSHLFRSVAEAFGRSALGILLTGMGRDGATGLQQIQEAGGITIAQDEETSVIFGMPAEAIRLGAAKYVLPPMGIAAAIRSLVTRNRG